MVETPEPRLGDLQGVIDKIGSSVKELTLREVFSHDPGRDPKEGPCEICQFKEGLDSKGYLRGVSHGIQLRDRFPNTDFGDLNG